LENASGFILNPDSKEVSFVINFIELNDLITLVIGNHDKENLITL